MRILGYRVIRLGQVSNDLMTVGSTTQNAIIEAEIITLDIGANDLLSYLEAEEGDVSNLLERLAYMDQDQINYLIYQMDSLKSSAVPLVVYQVSIDRCADQGLEFGC